MRKSAFCICENNADQLTGNRKADQLLCFCYKDRKIPLLPKSKTSGLEPSSVAVQPSLYSTVVSDLVGNPEDRFSHNEAHL